MLTLGAIVLALFAGLFGLSQMRPHARTEDDRERIDVARVGIVAMLKFIGFAVLFAAALFALGVVLVLQIND